MVCFLIDSDSASLIDGRWIDCFFADWMDFAAGVFMGNVLLILDILLAMGCAS